MIDALLGVGIIDWMSILEIIHPIIRRISTPILPPDLFTTIIEQSVDWILS